MVATMKLSWSHFRWIWFLALMILTVISMEQTLPTQAHEVDRGFRTAVSTDISLAVCLASIFLWFRARWAPRLFLILLVAINVWLLYIDIEWILRNR